jgi:DHA1 family tetracycline resistance protein-like MFS transporter
MKRLLPLYFIMFADVLGWGIILTILAPMLLGSHDYFAKTTPHYVRALSYGFLSATFPIGQFFGAPFFGELSDQFGRKKVLSISLFGSCIGFLLSAASVWVHSLLLLFFSRLLSGAFSGNQTLAMAAISDLSPSKKRGKYLSYTGLYSGMGFILGPYFGGKLAEPNIVSWFNFSTPFLFSSLVFFIVFGWTLLFFKESFKAKEKIRFHLTKGFANIKSIFQFQELKTLFLTYLIWLIGWMFFITFYSALLFELYKFNQGMIGDYNGFLAIMFALGSYALGKLLGHTKITAAQLITIPCILIGSCAFLITLHNTWLLIVATGVIGLFLTCGWMNFQTVASLTAPKEVQGKVFGICVSMQSLALIISPIIGGFLFIHGSKIPLDVAAVLMVLGGICYHIFYYSNHSKKRIAR